MSTEAQHKLLSADLEHADPAVFEIIRRVCEDAGLCSGGCADYRVGETKTEALHQPHSLRELHKPGCAGCAWECYAEYAGRQYELGEYALIM